MGDLVAALRPLSEFRAKLLNKDNRTDAELLNEATDIWCEATTRLMYEGIRDWDTNDDYPVILPPRGYDELTALLAWWCDASPYSIDPTPFSECWRFAVEAAADARTKRLGTAFDDLGRSWVRAFHVINRMRYAAAVECGSEPTPIVGKPGRPKSNDVKLVEQYIRDGLDTDAICELTNKSAASVRQIRSRLRRES